MIIRTYFDDKKYLLQHSTLYTYINHFKQKNISVKKTFFHYLEKLIFHNFDTCVVVLFLTHISNQKDIKKTETAEKYI